MVLPPLLLALLPLGLVHLNPVVVALCHLAGVCLPVNHPAKPQTPPYKPCMTV
jgi:hypothetical protein